MIRQTRQVLWFSLVLLTGLCTTSGVSAKEPVVHDYKFGEGITLASPTGHQLRISGYVQPYLETKSYTDDGDSEYYHRFRLRRLRLRLSGRAPQHKISYRLQVDLSGATETDAETSDFLMDAFVAYHVTKRIKLTIGQRSTFTDNRELFVRSHTLQLVERSRVTSSFAAIREFGLFAEGRFRLGPSGQYIKPYFVLTNGDGPNVFGNDRGGLKVGGRLDYLPFGLFYNMGQFREVDIVRELTPKLVVGVAYSYNQGMSSRRGRESADILYLDENGQESLPDFQKLGIDFLFKYKGFSILGEYNVTRASVPDDITQRVRNDGSISTTFQGGVENYVKGRMMLGQGYNLQAGFIFSTHTSVDIRYCRLIADEHSFLNNGTFYNRQAYYTAGLGQLFDYDYGLKTQVSLTFVDALDGSNDIWGEPIPGDEWIGRLMTTLAF